MGSSPIRVAIFQLLLFSIGKCAAGRSVFVLRLASVAQLVEQGTENPRVAGSIPAGGTNFPSILLGKSNASVAHLVERHLAKVEVASSSLVTRSKFFGALCGSIWCHSQVVRQSSAKAPLPSSNLGGTSRKRHDFCRVFLLFAPVLS